MESKYEAFSQESSSGSLMCYQVTMNMQIDHLSRIPASRALHTRVEGFIKRVRVDVLARINTPSDIRLIIASFQTDASHIDALGEFLATCEDHYDT